MKKVAVSQINKVSEVAKLNSTDVRQLASELKIKNYAKQSKDVLITMVQEAITQMRKPAPKVTKAGLLRNVMADLTAKGQELNSGVLMTEMETRHNVQMHRSFVITVRNSFLAA